MTTCQVILNFRFAGIWFQTRQDLESANNPVVCSASKMTPRITNGTESLQEIFSYQIANQTGATFPIFNISISIVQDSSTPGVLYSSFGSFNSTQAVVDIVSSNGLYDYVVLTNGPSFSSIQVLTRLPMMSAQQDARFTSFLAANSFQLGIREVVQLGNCRYAFDVTPNAIPPTPSDAAASNNRVIIIVGSVVGAVAFFVVAVRILNF
jgi:hypothetical protein